MVVDIPHRIPITFSVIEISLRLYYNKDVYKTVGMIPPGRESMCIQRMLQTSRFYANRVSF